MIIWLSSYPRSGNTFFRVLLNSIFDIKTYSIYDDRYDIGADKATSDIVGHVFLPDDFDLQAMRSDNTIYIIKTHDLPDDKIDKDDKIIYLMRDGRESTLSFFKYSTTYTDYKRELIDFIRMGTWGEHVKQWNPIYRNNTLLIKFEELTSQPEKLIQEISSFTTLQPINNSIPSFEELQAINPKFFRSGKKDSWKQHYSDEEHLLFWSKNSSQMIEHKYLNNIPSDYITDTIEEKIKSIPLISIITVTKDAKQQLEETIKSITTQTYPSVEYIIIDGDSKDGSKELIKNYANFIKYSISEKDEGIYDAMNKGLAQVSGEWVVFLNAGDIFVDENLLYSFANNIDNNIDIFYGSRYIENNHLQETEKLDHFYSLMPFGHQGAFTKAKLFEKYSFDKTYKLSADYDFFLKCYTEDYKFENLHFPICHFDTQGLSKQLKITSLVESLYILSKYVDEERLKESLLYKSLSGYIFNEDTSDSSKSKLRDKIKDIHIISQDKTMLLKKRDDQIINLRDVLKKRDDQIINLNKIIIDLREVLKRRDEEIINLNNKFTDFRNESLVEKNRVNDTNRQLEERYSRLVKAINSNRLTK